MLNGWKAIAAYLRRDERTAMRWAAERGLPVHRVPGPGRGSVYATPSEIDAWLAVERTRNELSRAEPPQMITMMITGTTTEPPAPLASWWPRWMAGALIATGLTLASVGVLTRPPPRTERIAPATAATDPATRALLLQASYDWNLRTPDSLARARREYSDAIGRDPRLPSAYVGLANAYLLLREFGSLPDAEAYPRAEAAARAASALEPASAEAHRALGFIAFWWRQDRAAARREFDLALALKPNDPLTHHWLANALLANGEARAALREIDSARELDPDATSIVADRAAILYFAGQHAEGLASLRELEHEQPNDVGPHRTIAEIALFEGRSVEFLREAAATARLRGDAEGLAAIERWQAAGIDQARIVAEMLLDARRRRAGWFQIAKLSALANRPDQAKDALARACEMREAATVSAPVDLWLSRALSHEDIVERCGRALPLV